MLDAYEQTQNFLCFSQAFDIFMVIYRKVRDSFENLKKVYLKNVAPTLVLSNKFFSSIPGMYRLNSKNVIINGFNN